MVEQKREVRGERSGVEPHAVQRVRASVRAQPFFAAVFAADPPDRDGPPSRPPARPPADPSREADRGLATKQRPKVERPPQFKVILYNDDYTPMEFVVQVLEKVFGKSPSAATQIMLQIHRSGMGVGGVYVLEIAETKSATVLRMAEERGYPLRSGVEKE